MLFACRLDHKIQLTRTADSTSMTIYIIYIYIYITHLL